MDEKKSREENSVEDFYTLKAKKYFLCNGNSSKDGDEWKLRLIYETRVMGFHSTFRNENSLLVAAWYVGVIKHVGHPNGLTFRRLW